MTTTIRIESRSRGREPEGLLRDMIHTSEPTELLRMDEPRLVIPRIRRQPPYRILVAGFGIASLAGCAGSTGPLFQSVRHTPVALQAGHATLDIRDARAGVAPIGFNIPSLTIAGQGDSAVVVLPAHLDSLLHHEIDSRLAGGPRRLHFQVMVVRADVGWRVGNFSENVFARATLQVKVFDGPGGALLAENTGASWGEHKAFDADVEDLSPLFQRVLVDAFVRFLDQPINHVAINRQSSPRTPATR